MKKLILYIMIVASLCLCITGCKSSMTKVEPRTYEYKVVSVYHYIKPNTNGWGGIIDYESKYYFAYIDNNGDLQEITDFQHTPNGIHKVCVGQENKYVVQDSGVNTYKWLYLTEETLNSMNTIPGE